MYLEYFHGEAVRWPPSQIPLEVKRMCSARASLPPMLLLLRRAPSASDRVLEEALCTAKRLLEGLVCSARLHLDESFLPPRSGTEVM